ncbi:MAG: hypothetical protein LBM75_01470 [Myxococcales bacterium]|jgi:hypothetical protein|nr:hypothetical protein [Myxococcales bacterium]
MATDFKFKSGIDDRLDLEIRDHPPKATGARQRRKVSAREIFEGVALSDDVNARVSVLPEPIRLALCEKAPPELITDAERE